MPKKRTSLKTKKECVFCKIVSKEIPSFKIYEDEDFYAFLDISRFTDGHTLVIPKKHIKFIWDSEDIGKYYSTAQKIANHYRTIGYKHVDSVTFGRKVPHAHKHLVPHNNDRSDYKNALENLGEMQEDTEKRLNAEEGKKIAEKFRLSS